MIPYQKIPKGFLAGRLVAQDILLLPNGEKQNIGSIAKNVGDIGDVIAVSSDLKLAVLLAPSLEETKLIDSHHWALQWPKFLQSIRDYFKSEEFNEVNTPTLVQSSGAETHLDPFTTAFKGKTYYLPTSPEFHLKRLLSSGINKIFEIKTCFRQDEASITHSPEFTMLEWYRGYAGIDEIIKDVKGLLKYVGEQTTTDVVSMKDLFKRYLDFELSPQITIEELKTICPESESTDTWSDVFFRIFLEKIEPQIGIERPIIVRDFPPTMSALARINEQGWADRFEVYWRGLELGNAYDELNDPVECEKRLKQWNQEKKFLGKASVPLSKELISALRSGMPPSGGIAVGLERLFMAINNINDINKTRFFSSEK
ncbi:MAG: hypothetical protein A4S09_04585 [Proteobacteria bacterium SG_bin7]|nr:MAG: hypothetical protein A4S09_04585 [Proteobacteria bacterium SG_bin7]